MCRDDEAIEVIVKAVEAVYRAKTGEHKKLARVIERDAVKALEDHRKKHGC
jgi:hypothetical protein